MPALMKKITGGVDTHADVHVAAVLHSTTGRLLGTKSFPTTITGYDSLISWVASFGAIDVVGVESTGSYGAGLTRCLHAAGIKVVEVDRPDRKARRHTGKTDTVDAIAAAQAALSGRAAGIPKRRDGDIEAVRQLELVRRSAVNARTAAINTFHALVITAPNDLREHLRRLDIDTQLTTARRWRTREHETLSTTACRDALRELAVRVEQLTAQIERLDAQLQPLTAKASPALVGLFGVGPHVAAALLTSAGDNPERLHSDAAFAKLTGCCPIPASSGKTNRHRLNQGGDRQANNALFTIALVRMRYHAPTRAYVARRTQQGKTKPEIIRCLKRYIAREVYTAITHPPANLPTGNELRHLRQQAGLSLTTVASHHHISPTELSRLERGLTHHNDLTQRIHQWLKQHA
jgi:transposase